MRRLLLCLPLVMICVIPLYADNVLSLSVEDGKPGDIVTITANMVTTSDVYAAEFSIPLTKELSYVDGSFEIECSNLGTTKHSISNSDGGIKVYFYNTSLTAMPQLEGKLFSFKVKLTKEPGEYIMSPKVILSDIQGKNIYAKTSSASIKILASKLDVLQDTINYGRIPIRSKYSKVITIVNHGTIPMNISSLACSSGVISFSESSFVVPANGSKDIDVFFAPKQHGVIDESIIITSDAINGNMCVIAKANAYSVNELAVASTSGESGDNAQVAVSLNNMEDLSAVQCSFKLPSELFFVENSLELSDRCKGMQSFASVQDGILKLYIYSMSNATIKEGKGHLATFKLKLLGTSGDYVLEPIDVILGNSSLNNMVSGVIAGSVNIVSPIIVCDTIIDMGTSPITKDATSEYVIHNNGGKELILEKIVFADSSLVCENTFPISVPAGDSYPLLIKYAPNSIGQYSTKMKIYTTDPVNNVVDVVISGSVYEPNNLTLASKMSSDMKSCILSVRLENYSEIVAAQMTIHGIKGMMTDKSQLSLSQRCADYSYVVTETEGGDYRVILYSLSNTPILGNSGTLFELKFTSPDRIVSNDLTWNISDIVLSDSKSNNLVSENSVNGGTEIEKPAFILGDANCDGNIDVADISAIVAYVYGTPSIDFNITTADVNKNGIINVSDISGVIDLINETK